MTSNPPDPTNLADNGDVLRPDHVVVDADRPEAGDSETANAALAADTTGKSDSQASESVGSTSEPAPTAPAPEPAPLLDMLDLETVSDEVEPDVSFTSNGVTVTGTDAQDVRVDLESLCRLACSVALAESITSAQIDLHLVNVDVITQLNEDHLGGTGATDVLSFPLDADDFVAPVGNGDLPPLLGDVVLCPTVAESQAEGHAGSSEAEFSLLVIHGVLHLLGHDHAEDAETHKMQARERVHLEALGFEHPVVVP